MDAVFCFVSHEKAEIIMNRDVLIKLYVLHRNPISSSRNGGGHINTEQPCIWWPMKTSNVIRTEQFSEDFSGQVIKRTRILAEDNERCHRDEVLN